jgi:hypothetical protein
VITTLSLVFVRRLDLSAVFSIPPLLGSVVLAYTIFFSVGLVAADDDDRMVTSAILKRCRAFFQIEPQEI